jgi:hypothetical protein
MHADEIRAVRFEEHQQLSGLFSSGIFEEYYTPFKHESYVLGKYNTF